MDPQEEGWPLGLRLLNGRVGLVRRSRDFNGSISFSTLVTGSPTSSTDSSSDLDTESTGSFFNDKSITLGSLLRVSSILHLSRRSSSRGVTAAETLRNQKNYKPKPWLFSLCSRLTTDAINTSNTPSLGHFLEAERRAAANIHRRNTSPTTFYGTNDLSPIIPDSNLDPLFVNGQVAAPQSRPPLGAYGNGYGNPPLLSCLRGN